MTALVLGWLILAGIFIAAWAKCRVRIPDDEAPAAPGLRSDRRRIS